MMHKLSLIAIKLVKAESFVTNQPTKQLTIRAAVVHHYNLLQQVFRGAVDDAMQGSFDDRQGLIQVDEHNSDIRQILRVFLLRTPIQNQEERLAFAFFSFRI